MSVRGLGALGDAPRLGGIGPQGYIQVAWTQSFRLPARCREAGGNGGEMS